MEYSGWVGSPTPLRTEAVSSKTCRELASWWKIFLNLWIFHLRPRNVCFRDEPWQLKVAIDLKAWNICTGAGDEDAAEVDLLGEGLVLELDSDLFVDRWMWCWEWFLIMQKWIFHEKSLSWVWLFWLVWNYNAILVILIGWGYSKKSSWRTLYPQLWSSPCCWRSLVALLWTRQAFWRCSGTDLPDCYMFIVQVQISLVNGHYMIWCLCFTQDDKHDHYPMVKIINMMMLKVWTSDQY